MTDAEPRGRLRRLLALHDGEAGPVLLAAAYHFFLMAAYFILRPLREEMGVRGGARNLELLWLGTLVTSLCVLPPYWKLVSHVPRRRFIPIINRFVLATLVVFFVLLRWLPEGAQIWAARCFYVWVSVFNLFVLTVFWSFMADSFSPAQGRRLFGLIAVGGTSGALLGLWLTMSFARELKTVGLLLVSALLLEVATQFALAFARRTGGGTHVEAVRDRSSLRAQWVAGFRLLARSPYLLGAAGYLFLSTLASSFAYAQRTELMQENVRDSAVRTAVFAWSDFVTQGLAFAGQSLLSARVVRWIGTGATLSVQMVFAAAGFVAVAIALEPATGAAGAATSGSWWSALGLPLPAGAPQSLVTIVVFFALLKAVEYSFSKPARESLFTVVTRAEKYQCKSLIDTGLYRAFDQVQIIAYSRLHEVNPISLGLSLQACSYVVAPVLLTGVVLSSWLGRKQAELAAQPPVP